MVLYDMTIMKNTKQDKLDKRAAALRDNLKRRKTRAQSEKDEKNDATDTEKNRAG
ncbi:MAG TPA: hypothetical protein PK513_02670 [Alphaproteobacteria bacterium]|nr:hypothetical protein [Alphaproteobacteria bacterium]